MGKYRKKPVVIEAWQWSFDANTPIEFCWAVAVNTGAPTIYTLEGPHHVSESDMIIKGVKGEFYACKPDIFAMTYEEA